MGFGLDLVVTKSVIEEVSPKQNKKIEDKDFGSQTNISSISNHDIIFNRRKFKQMTNLKKVLNQLVFLKKNQVNIEK